MDELKSVIWQCYTNTAEHNYDSIRSYLSPGHPPVTQK